jgi:hypothetical protein
LAKAAEAAEAIIAGTGLDARKLRTDFPIFQQRFHGKPLAYLDSAVSAQKPRQVLDAHREFYETSYTNVHRGVYLLAERATERFEGSREKVRAFINAASRREIVFTRSATEALNLVAYAWGLDNLGPANRAAILIANGLPEDEARRQVGPPPRPPRAADFDIGMTDVQLAVRHDVWKSVHLQRVSRQLGLAESARRLFRICF